MTNGSSSAPTPDENGRTIANATYLGLAQLLVPLSRGVYALVLVGSLGPEAYGLLSYALGLTLCILPLGAWSFELDLVHRLGVQKNARRLVRTSLSVQMMLAAASGGLVVGYALGVESGALRVTVLCYAVGLIGRLLAGWARAVLVGFERARVVFVVEAPLRIAEVAAGLVAVRLGAGIRGVIVAYVLAWWLQAILLTVLVLRESRASSDDVDAPRLAAFDLVRAGLWSALSLLALTWLRQGPLIIFRFAAATPAELGRFALAAQLLMIGGGVGAAASAAAIPMLSRAMRRGEERDVELITAVVPALSLGFGIVTVLVELTSGVLPGSFASVRTLLAPTVLAMLPATLTAFGLHVLTARAAHRTAAVTMIASAIASALASVVLDTSPRAELAASAVGWCIAAILLGVALCRSRAFAARAVVTLGFAVAGLPAALAFVPWTAPLGRLGACAVAVLALFGGMTLSGAFRNPIWKTLWRYAVRT